MNLAQTVLGIDFVNPTLLASGIWGLHAEDCRRYAAGAGGLTIKSFGLAVRPGHPDPIIVRGEHYTLNAVGLPSPGMDKIREEFGPLYTERPVPIIQSIMAESVEAFGETAEVFAQFKPDAFEVNISCPNVHDELGRPFACSPVDAAAVTKIVKQHAGKIPIFLKLSPNVDNIGAIAKACADAGADGLTLINTLGPGMVIDLKTRKPILSNKVGGVSGSAVKPIAVRCIADAYKATGGKLPIIGVGGVRTGEDAIEFMMAGASLVAIGTAIWERGDDVFRTVCDEMKEWGKKEGVNDVSELVGAVTR